jgi:hypothetical protein
MAVRGETPATFGLRVRSHPVLMVTSRIKMRYATTLKLSYTGSVSETVVLDPSRDTIAANFNLTDRFLEQLPKAEKTSNRVIWSGVPGEDVLDYVRLFNTHRDADRANSQFLADYINKQLRVGELTEWTVVLVSRAEADSGKTHATKIGGHDVTCLQRRGLQFEDDRLSIRRLLSPSDEGLDLTDQEVEKAKALSPNGVVVGQAVRDARAVHRGLLLLYPLDPYYFDPKRAKVVDGIIIGLGISFPNSHNAQTIDYEVNPIYMREEYGE